VFARFRRQPDPDTLRRIEAPRQWLHTRRRIEASAVAAIVKTCSVERVSDKKDNSWRMNDSLLKASADALARPCRADDPRSIVPSSKMTDYIAGLRMVIATARVASVILAVEGYVCAPQQ